jgi:hypothetical protein
MWNASMPWIASSYPDCSVAFICATKRNRLRVCEFGGRSVRGYSVKLLSVSEGLFCQATLGQWGAILSRYSRSVSCFGTGLVHTLPQPDVRRHWDAAVWSVECQLFNLLSDTILSARTISSVSLTNLSGLDINPTICKCTALFPHVFDGHQSGLHLAIVFLWAFTEFRVLCPHESYVASPVSNASVPVLHFLHSCICLPRSDRIKSSAWQSNSLQHPFGYFSLAVTLPKPSRYAYH